LPGFFDPTNPVSANVGPDQLPTTEILAYSQTIYSCDPVVWTSANGSQNRVRLLVQDDIDDLYVNSSTAGILGFMPASVATSSGVH
jgi:hypothetical protein